MQLFTLIVLTTLKISIVFGRGYGVVFTDKISNNLVTVMVNNTWLLIEL